MTSELRTAKEIFVELVTNVATQQWDERLEDDCKGDKELENRVRALLRAHAEPGSFMNQPAVAVATADFPGQSLIGTQIGPYKLREQIGEGGMGVVYVAEQTEPVKRKVALKLIKPGMDTRQVVARFEAERQALAMMDHPNIARVFDGGNTSVAGSLREPSPAADSATDDGHGTRSVPAPFGQPYFVMELVQGLPITEFCDQHGLSTRERLQLFLQVCRAVQHAHQKGIIHRDLKPSNVLVPEIDGVAVPKVIDFGVAKAVNQELTEQTLYTQFSQMVGTPLYMSPEQAGLGVIDVDTRSDIYSLGVLLYELLTGNTPFDGETLKRAGFDEMRRIIREDEPPKPSAMVSTLDAQALSTVAQCRGSDPRRLSNSLAGELDWIVMKAMEKDRSRRYETANKLAEDVEHYLNDEAVEACPPTAVYRLRKYARRNKAALLFASAAVGALLLVVVGLVVTNRLIAAERNETAKALVEKEQALTEAETERERAHKNFLQARIAVRDIITQAAMGLDEWGQLPSPLRKRFSDAAVKYYSGLIQDAGPQPTLQYDAAVAYCSIGKLHAMAGELDAAEEPYRNSIQILDRLAAQFPADRRYREQLAWSYYDLGETLLRQKRFIEAQSCEETAVKLYENLLRETPDETDYRNQLAHCLHCQSSIFVQVGDSERATESLRREISILETITNEQTHNRSRDRRLAESSLLLADLLARLGQESEARRLTYRAIELYDQLAAESPYVAADMLYSIALMQLQLRDEAGYRATCKALVQLPVLDTKFMASERSIWTPCLGPDALDDLDLHVKRAEQFAAEHVQDGPHFGLCMLGAAHYRAGQYDQAVVRLEESIAAYSTSPKYGFDTLNYPRLLLAMAKWQQGRKDAARQSLAEAQLAVTEELETGPSWNRRATLELLRREAESLIKPNAADEAVENKSRTSDESKR